MDGYSHQLAVFGNQFSNRTFMRYFGRNFENFSDEELVRFLYRMRDCARYSPLGHHIVNQVAWLFDPKIIESWQRKYPHTIRLRAGTSYFGYFDFEEPLPSEFIQTSIRKLQSIRKAQTEVANINHDLNVLFMQPESEELEYLIEEFRRKHLYTLNLLDSAYSGGVLKEVRARWEMLQASRALASRFKLSEYPKLPPPSKSNESFFLDDTLLIPLTDDEILELERDVVQDF